MLVADSDTDDEAYAQEEIDTEEEVRKHELRSDEPVVASLRVTP